MKVKLTDQQTETRSLAVARFCASFCIISALQFGLRCRLTVATQLHMEIRACSAWKRDASYRRTICAPFIPAIPMWLRAVY